MDPGISGQSRAPPRDPFGPLKRPLRTPNSPKDVVGKSRKGLPCEANDFAG
jgi:hypothetical protein